MPVSIVSNLSSQFAQSSIRLRNEHVTLSTQRLSSGQRVFAASEDPAAVAVATGLRVENAALANAQINAAGGVSMLQIADGALAQIGDIAIRLKALATQASSFRSKQRRIRSEIPNGNSQIASSSRSSRKLTGFRAIRNLTVWGCWMGALIMM